MGGKKNTQPQTLRLQSAFAAIQADSKGGEDGIQQFHAVTPGLQCPILVTVPAPSAGPPPRQGDRSLLPPPPICHHSSPHPGSALQLSPACTYSSVALERVLRYCQLRAASSMAQDR